MGGSLAVRVYDYASVDAPVLATAVDEARAIVTAAGAEGAWHRCMATGPGCAPEPRDLVVRIVRENGAPVAEWRRPLGFAVIDGTRGTGRLATIYINRIEDSARHAGTDVPALLGRAIAHEVGHLILLSNEHGDHGLMRAVWTEDEMARNAPEDWVFALPEQRRIRAALQKVGSAAAR